MHSAGFTKSFIVLADDNGKNPVRTKNAGRIKDGMGLSKTQWKEFAAGAEKVAKAVKDKYGMKTVFHHHCAGFIETPDEVARRIETAERALGPDRVGWVHPDCGFWMLKRSIADRKIAALVKGRNQYLGIR